MVSEWVRHQEVAFRAFTGCRVVGFTICEMAAIEGDPGGVRYRDPAIPVIQAVSLFVHLVDNTHRRIYTYQNDTTFGLGVDHAGDPSSPCEDLPVDGNSIYRPVDLDSLPTGEVLGVRTSRNRFGDISEVMLDVGDSQILLMTGELEEQLDGSIRARMYDESIFIVCPPAQRAMIPWYT